MRGGVIKNPINQKRLTNVTIVSYGKGKEKVQVAAYPNKIKDFRNNIEKDISNVVQSDKVYSDVGRGSLAKRELIKNLFGKKSNEEIISEIIMNGDFKTNEYERSVDASNKNSQILTIIQEKTVNPQSAQPYPIEVLETAVKKLQFKLNENLPVKPSALMLIKKLCSSDVIILERKKMKFRIFTPEDFESEIFERFSENGIFEGMKSIETEEGQKCHDLIEYPSAIEVLNKLCELNKKFHYEILLMEVNNPKYYGRQSARME